MAVAQRFPAAPPEVPHHRLIAVSGSIAGHLLLIVTLVVLGRYAAVEEEPEPIRLVFVEPAPPPKLGVPDGGAAAAPAGPEPAPAPEPAAPEAMEYVGEPALMPPRPAHLVEKPKPEPKPEPKPRAPAKPEPKAKPRVARTERTAPQAAAPAAPRESGASAGTVSAPQGNPQGHEAGVAGGLVGGQVGGLGSDLTPLRQAAVPPRVTHRVMPEYPESARLRGIEGQVLIEAVIARDGSVEPGVKVVQSIPALDDAAVEAFKKWRFSPARDAQGRPLRVILQAPVRFVLR